MASVFSSLVKNVGIDMGTTMTRVYVGGRMPILSEQSIVATDAKQQQIIAVGSEADIMIRRAPDLVKEMSPFIDGVIADYRITRMMIQYFVKKAIGNRFRRSRIMMTVPYSITDVEKRAMADAILQIGSREAYLVPSPVLIGLSEGAPLFAPHGTFIADIGGGRTEAMIISMGGIVVGRSARIGTNDFNKAIVQYMQDHFQVMVSESTVEGIKLSLGTAIAPREEEEVPFRGRDIFTGLYKQLVIRKTEVYQIFEEPIARMIDAIRSVLEQAPPELAADIMAEGMILSGGGAKIEGIAGRIQEEFGIKVRLPQDPILAVTRGFESAYREIDQMERLLISRKDRKGK